MRKLMFALFVTLSLSLVALADIPRPTATPTPSPTPRVKTKKSIDSRLDIVLTQTDEAVLRIPKSQIVQLRAQLDAADGGEATTAAVTKSSLPFSRLQTIVSGAFLSLAVVFGGLWFSRKKVSASKTGKIMASLALLFLCGAATANMATIAFANAGPPPEARSITGKMFTDAVHMYKSGSGAIKLEVKEDENDQNSVDLIVPDPKGFPMRDE